MIRVSFLPNQSTWCFVLLFVVLLGNVHLEHYTWFFAQESLFTDLGGPNGMPRSTLCQQHARQAPCLLKYLFG